MAQTEVSKLQQHLKLLKEEYTKLQTTCSELERKYNLASASAGELNETSFVARLLSAVALLHGRETYSDIKFKLKDKTIPGHKLVLNARSDKWNEEALSNITELDWSNLEEASAEAIIRYIYTDSVDLTCHDEGILELMKTAHEFGLTGLLNKCEQTLISRAGLRNCVKFYSIGESLGAAILRDHCSALISAHWDDLTGGDFEHMSGPLLYRMLKAKTTHPLHTAVKLGRDDVVFLYLVEHNANLSKVINEWNPSGDLPLDLALSRGFTSIAVTLVQHAADVDARDSRGDTLLLRSLRRGDRSSAMFLIERGADPRLTAAQTTSETALHLVAADTDALDVAQKLVDSGANVNAQNSHGYTALHIAMMSGNSAIGTYIINLPKVDLNLKTLEEDHTALYYALVHTSDNETFPLATQLIEKDATVNPIYVKTGDSLLHVLASQGLVEATDFVAMRADNINHVNRRGETALHVACKHGPESLVTALLNRGANPNLVDNESQSPLHIAVRSELESCVKALVEYMGKHSPIELELRDTEGFTPLAAALQMTGVSMATPLITAGADVNSVDGNGYTLLHQAILKQDSETALFLLQNGAEVDSLTPDNETPLQLSVHCRLPMVVEALCVRGVDMGRLDAQGSPALWAALDTNQEDVASTLVRHGADPDCWGAGPDGCLQTLLHRAIDVNHQSAAVFLVQAGCDRDSPRRPGPNGEGGEEARDNASPLHLCCQWGLENVVQTLVEHGANINAKDADMKTPLHIAIENQHPTIITLLLCHPSIDLGARDKVGLSPFATALTYRNNSAAQAILDRFPAAAEQVDGKGRNFLHTAILKGDLESVLFLLSVQVDVNSRVQDSNLTPSLHLAAQAGNEMLVRSLLLAGSRANDTDARKQTALHAAAEAGQAAIVSALLQNGANYDAINSEGDNALHIAAREGHLAVVRALLTESQLDAETINLKGRNPLHELCRCVKDNGAAIFELFLECMPKYPIDKPDLSGNTPLLLAYMKGNGSLCRAIVKAHACIGAENKEGVTIFNYQVASKQLLHRLLDQLSQEPPWTEAEVCQECGNRFGLTTRKHHCRHCGRCLCSKCSSMEVPIVKFGLNKPVRVCEVCFQVLQVGSS